MNDATDPADADLTESIYADELLETELSSASVKATGQKQLSEVLDEMDAGNSSVLDPFKLVNTNAKLVKALRYAAHAILTRGTLHGFNANIELASISSILTESDKASGDKILGK